MLRSLLRATVIYAVAVVPVAGSTQRPVRVTGIYSDLRYLPGPGDVVGTEVIISRIDSGFQFQFQRVEGAPGRIDTVPATIHGDSVFFELPPDTVRRLRPDHSWEVMGVRRHTFRGRITAASLQGRVTGWTNELLLPRRARSYWSR